MLAPSVAEVGSVEGNYILCVYLCMCVLFFCVEMGNMTNVGIPLSNINFENDNPFLGVKHYAESKFLTPVELRPVVS